MVLHHSFINAANINICIYAGVLFEVILLHYLELSRERKKRKHTLDSENVLVMLLHNVIKFDLSSHLECSGFERNS